MANFTEAYKWMKKGNKAKITDSCDGGCWNDDEIFSIDKERDLDRLYGNVTEEWIELSLTMMEAEWELILPEYTEEQKELIKQFCEHLKETMINEGWSKGDMHHVGVSINLVKERYGIGTDD
jgi:hypothetical protein